MVFNIVVSDENLIKGAKELGSFCNFTVNESGFKVVAKKTDESLRIEFDSAEFRLFYSKESEFYLGLSYCVQFFGTKQGSLSIKDKSRLGLMRICNGNATPKVQTLKDLIKIMALLGYEYFVLAVEDLFDINDLAYLGSFKYKINNKYVKEIDEYAKIFGIELIPGIQALCPMACTRSRDAFVSVMTYGDTLLVGEEQTYKFLENIISFCAQTFSSKKIHLGMEQTKNIRQGAYFRKNGYVSNTGEIFIEHVEKVLKIAEKYSLSSSVWADNIFYGYFNIDCKNGYNKVKDNAISFEREYQSLSKVKWGIRAYPKYNGENYETATKLFHNANDNYYLACDLCTGLGFLPLSLNSQFVVDDAFKLCEKYNDKDCLFIMSDDNGAECSCFSALSTLIYASEKFYGNKTDKDSLDNRTKSLFNVEFSTLNDLAFPCVNNGESGAVNPCKYLFYNDLLIGIFDTQVKEGVSEDIKAHYIKLSDKDFSSFQFSYIFDTAKKLFDFLIYKSELGVKITKLYQSKDLKGLNAIANKILPCLVNKLNDFYQAFKFQWHKENHAVGYEIFDVRLGGLKERLIKTSKTLKDYLNGKIKRIEELEQKRMPYSTKYVAGQDVLFNSYREIVSGSDI